ncbi:VOC family protein [Nocardioides sp. LML1-1-1.1]|uniref:VOC family protein n=1 Tax=Nocardioides sp. LML1-1-1.1 TaxID=3135248 RepID=UPI0034286DFA
MSVLHRVIVSVASTEAALRFYGDLLGLPVERSGPMTRLGDGPVEVLLHERPTAPSDRAVALSLRVADVDTTSATWARAGGVVVDPPADQPWGERQAVVRDPDGHLVCLVGARG